ncbi:hypothetical protein PTE30175_02354 [Pandoraea terrae]|uniref:Uncharacterized protein n=2 Tax=Pandoraea terrae TaxID=1537710 RepID=A0A5E4V4N9_9BURK|nr:hypothetical protein PTE30175_02354 [Pandoraea terrae]
MTLIVIVTVTVTMTFIMTMTIFTTFTRGTAGMTAWGFPAGHETGLVARAVARMKPV